jgi:hypothetical protein
MYPGPAGTEGRGQIHTGHYVQVRYPQGGRGVTVAASDTRTSAATVAADAYRERHDPRGQAPSQVRIVSAAQLVHEGGEQELGVADAELIGAAKARRPLDARDLKSVNRRKC